MRTFLLTLSILTAAACSARPPELGGAATGSGGTGGEHATASSSASTSGSGGSGGVPATPCMPTPASGTLAWAKRAGGPGWEGGNGVAAAADGSVTITGNFDLPAIFGANDPGKVVLIPSIPGGTDMFVARYDAKGAIVWAKHAGGPPVDSTDVTSGNAIAPAADGGVFVAGEVAAQATFGEGEPNATTITPVALMDAFVARYRADGSFGWVAQMGGMGDDQGLAVAAMPDGGAVTMGSFQGTATFGAGTPAETMLVSNGGSDLYLARFAADGTFLWARGIGGPDDDAENGIPGVAVDDNGDIFVMGSFAATVTLGAGQSNQVVLNGPKTVTSSFLARYDAAGNLVWGQGLVGTSFSVSQQIALVDGGVVVLGMFDETLAVGGVTLTSAGNDDLFLARFDAGGALQWARSAGGDGIDSPVGLAVAPGGAIFVSGFFQFETSATFGAGETCQAALPKTGDIDLFVARYAGDGSFVWAHGVGGTTLSDDIQGGKLAVSAGGAPVVTGIFQGTVTFGAGSPGAVSLTANDADVFVAEYEP